MCTVLLKPSRGNKKNPPKALWNVLQYVVLTVLILLIYQNVSAWYTQFDFWNKHGTGKLSKTLDNKGGTLIFFVVKILLLNIQNYSITVL